MFAYLKYAHKRIKAHHVYTRGWANKIKYGRAAPRFADLIFVDPRDVSHVLAQQLPRAYSGSIISSDWDKNIRPLSETEKYIYCKKHFSDGIPWEDAGAYEFMKSAFAKSERPDGCRTWKDVQERYARLDELYAHVSERRRLNTRQELFGPRHIRESGGIYIHIDRCGNPVFGGGGCHRLAIAKLLNLSVIPAQIGAVHARAISNGSFPSATVPLVKMIFWNKRRGAVTAGAA